jgi:hypothetical protein
MDALKSATEIVKAWVAQQPRMSSNVLAKEMREIFLAAVRAYREALGEIRQEGR